MSARLNTAPLPPVLAQAMDAFAAARPALPLAVGYSGGSDSTALLLACAQRWPGQVVAWHVHHGLQAAGDAFERHCRVRCTEWDLPLYMSHVDARPRPGQSPQDAARQHRYAAFQTLATLGHQGHSVPSLALAQHADDQAETLLLALSRGSGLPGLSAMPARAERGALTLWRPLLDVPAATLRHWLHTGGVSWIEDPSNQSPHYTRNRMRQQLLPALEAVFPGFRPLFARSARHCAQAQLLLDELAAIDLQHCGHPPRIAGLQTLSEARRANLLRHWLHRFHAQSPSQAQLAELQSQILACRTRGHRIHIRVGAGHVLRQGDALHWQPDAPAVP